jgi:hypothetical protein
MENKLNQNPNELLDNEKEFKLNDDSEHEIDDDIDYDQITSHKLQKNTYDKKNKKKLIIILEHA